MVNNRNSQGLIRPYSGILGELFRLSDLTLIFASLWALTLLYKVNWDSQFSTVSLIGVLLFLLGSQIIRLYGTWRVAGLRQELNQVCLVWIFVLFGLLLLAYSTKISATFSRRVLLTWMMITPVVLCAYRVVIHLSLRRLREAGRNMRSAAIAGYGEQADKLASVIQSSPWLGVKFDGQYSSAIENTDKDSRQRLSDELLELIKRAKNNEIDIIFLAMPVHQQHQIEQFTVELADTTASLYYIPNFFLTDLLHARWGYLGDIPYLSLRETPFYGVHGTLKRLEDIILSSLILLLVSIPMLIISLAVKFTSKGPVLFKQQRYGLDGNEIKVWKFRSMTVTEDGDNIPQATRNDPRITPLGAFLRKTSLDELPQFINVIQGQMSIVGPRPHAAAHNEEYRKQIYGYMLRHKVKPGITGWAQINGWRGETDTLDKMENRVEHDIWYIRNWSVWLDLKIIFLTIIHGFTNPNAY